MYPPCECELYRVDNGGIRFKVRYPLGMGFAFLVLCARKDPRNELFQMFFEPPYRFINTHGGEQSARNFHLETPIGREFKEFWLRWNRGVVCLGVNEQLEPIMKYDTDTNITTDIGYVKFNLRSPHGAVEWEIESSPVVLKPLREKVFEGGELHWVELDGENPVVPENALIGGFEYEPLYIIRSPHAGSLCPGKYVPSKKRGYVPWGGREHEKQRNEILCGWNVKWVATRGNCIPENVFVAGFSEVRHEPLYIARALYDSQLLVGKVHTIWSTCYLPYKGKEIEVHDYEILVTTDVKPRSIPNLKKRQYGQNRQDE